MSQDLTEAEVREIANNNVDPHGYLHMPLARLCNSWLAIHAENERLAAELNRRDAAMDELMTMVSNGPSPRFSPMLDITRVHDIIRRATEATP